MEPSRKYIISVCVFYFSARPHRKILFHPRFHDESRRCHIVRKFAMLCRLGNREGSIYLCMINNRHGFSEYVKSTVAWTLFVESLDGGLTVYNFWGFTAVSLTISKVMVFTIMAKQPWLRKCSDARLKEANTCPGIRKQIPSSFCMFIEYTPGSCWWGRHSLGCWGGFSSYSL